MKVAYISSPYRSRKGIYEITRNIRRAEKAMVKLCRMGFAVFCPHKATSLLDGAISGPKYPGSGMSGAKTKEPYTIGDDGDFWINMDLEFLRRSDLVVALKGVSASEGCKIELAEANARNIPVYYFKRDKERLAKLALE